MLLTRTKPQPYWRSLLILGRVSNLPTVWSNCLAGWILGGGGGGSDGQFRFGLLCLGASLLYVGGMFLNDAFDAGFDQRHRPERPIPSGAIPVDHVWRWGAFWLGAGLVALASLGTATAALGLLLLVGILVYDAAHKEVAFAPVLMAGCRFLLYLVAASVGWEGVTGLAVWSGLALGAYVVGLSYIARRESTRGTLQYWPLLPLGAPILLVFIVNTGPYQFRSLVLALALTLWIVACLRHSFWAETVQVGRTVGGLLAGIVLVDLLALGGGQHYSVTLTLTALFLLTLLFQRFVPAT